MSLFIHSRLTSRTGLYLRRQELYVMNLIRISTVNMSFTRRLRPWSLQVPLILLQLLPQQGVLLIGRFKLWAYGNLQPYGATFTFFDAVPKRYSHVKIKRYRRYDHYPSKCDINRRGVPSKSPFTMTEKQRVLAQPRLRVLTEDDILNRNFQDYAN